MKHSLVRYERYDTGQRIQHYRNAKLLATAMLLLVAGFGFYYTFAAFYFRSVVTTWRVEVPKVRQLEWHIGSGSVVSRTLELTILDGEKERIFVLEHVREPIFDPRRYYGEFPKLYLKPPHYGTVELNADVQYRNAKNYLLFAAIAAVCVYLLRTGLKRRVQKLIASSARDQSI